MKINVSPALAAVTKVANPTTKSLETYRLLWRISIYHNCHHPRPKAQLDMDSMAFESSRNSIVDSKELRENEQVDLEKECNVRTDSGYGDDLTQAMEEDDEPNTKSSQPEVPLSRPTLNTTVCKAPNISSRDNPLADAWASAWPSCKPRRSSTSSSTYSITSKSLAHFNSTNQRSSTTPHVSSSSRMPSRRSASNRTPQASLYSSYRFHTSLRSTSTAHRSSFEADPYLVHERSRQLFGSPDSRMMRPSIERFSSLPNRPYDSIAEAEDDISGNTYDEKARATTHHAPCTVIDWTSPCTRRREYAEIDKSSRGLRGLWRRLAPRWCMSNSRLNFYHSGEEDDAKSVRRYRLDLPNLQERKSSSSESLRSQGKVRPDIQRSRTSWSCFRSERNDEKL